MMETVQVSGQERYTFKSIVFFLLFLYLYFGTLAVNYSSTKDGNITSTVTFRWLQVAWLRRQADRVSLLTVGTSAYSPDPRYSVRVLYPNNWRLVISPVRRQDEGSYLCQVATHPPRLLAVNLTVIGA